MTVCTQCGQLAPEVTTNCAEVHTTYEGQKYQVMQIFERVFTHRKNGLIKKCVERFPRPLVIKMHPMTEQQPLVLEARS